MGVERVQRVVVCHEGRGTADTRAQASTVRTAGRPGIARTFGDQKTRELERASAGETLFGDEIPSRGATPTPSSERSRCEVGGLRSRFRPAIAAVITGMVFGLANAAFAAEPRQPQANDPYAGLAPAPAPRPSPIAAERVVFRPPAPLAPDLDRRPITSCGDLRLVPAGELPSMSTSATMMELAALAHEEPETIRAVLAAAGMSLRHFGWHRAPMDALGQADDAFLERAFAARNTIDMQYYIAEAPGAIVVAFRGSEEREDYRAALGFIFADTLDGMAGVHPAFARGVELLWDDLRSQLKQLAATQHPPKPIVLTGHSFGAALSALAALRWQEREADQTDAPKVHSVFGFALPGVGGETFAARYSRALGDRTYTYINRGDAVTWLTLGRAEPRTRTLFLAKDGAVIENPGAWRRRVAFWGDTFSFKNGLPESFEYHRPGYYVSRLRQLRDAEAHQSTPALPR